MSAAPEGVASLPMYPFPAWRPATETLWDAVRDRMPDVPGLAPWGTDARALWHAPDLAVSQACGWPLVTGLANRVWVVGTFRYSTHDWAGDRYRSVIVARDGADLHDLAGARAAVNSHDSLSGWISLVWFAAGGPGGRWPGTTVDTGAHLESLRAVRDGEADLASIDAVTYAHAERDRPELLEGVRWIGEGPEVPCLPIVAGADRDPDWIDRLREALQGAVADQPDAAATLCIDGFSPLDERAYAPVAGLGPADQ